MRKVARGRRMCLACGGDMEWLKTLDVGSVSWVCFPCRFWVQEEMMGRDKGLRYYGPDAGECLVKDFVLVPESVLLVMGDL